MPLVFGPNFVEGKVYRGKKKKEEDEETQAIKEIQAILSNKSRRMCDCEAQVHDLIENCLGCGRLTCSAEGPGKCFHCGNLVISQEQRDRLQRHIDIFQAVPAAPSTSQQKPAVNNSFDHFAIDKMKHLSEDERRRLREGLDELESLKHKRKLMLDLDVENAEVNYRSEPVIEDYEEQLKLLQLSHQPTETVSSQVLSELVAIESKKRYNLTYVEPSVSKKNKAKSEPKSGQQKQGESSKNPKQKDYQSKKNKQNNRPQGSSQQSGQNKGDRNKAAKKPPAEKKTSSNK